MAASLLPLISELLPMIMPSSTQIVRGKDIEPQHPTVEGPAIERPVTFDKGGLSANVMTIRPSSHSTIRHNSEQDAMMYLVSGSGVLLVKESLQETPQRHALTQGDFVFLPAWTEHQMHNEDSEVDAVWVVFHVGSRPVKANLMDWGGAEDSTCD